jgi:hypothetical protein
MPFHQHDLCTTTVSSFDVWSTKISSTCYLINYHLFVLIFGIMTFHQHALCASTVASI